MVAFCVTVDLLESIGTRGKARVHRGSQMGGVASRAVLHRDSWYLMAGGERRGEEERREERRREERRGGERRGEERRREERRGGEKRGGEERGREEQGDI